MMTSLRAQRAARRRHGDPVSSVAAGACTGTVEVPPTIGGTLMSFAGAGVKPGFSYGATDDYGYYAVEDKMHIHDVHATILHLLGLDHEKLTYRYAGRDFRLTDVAGRVAREIIA